MPTGVYLRTEYHRAIISRASKGRTLSLETRQKISNAGRGKKRTLQTRMNISVALSGRTLSDERKQQMSELSKRLGLKPPSRKGQTMPLEWKRRMSKLMRGRFAGDRNHFWKGGVSKETDRIRHSIEYREWRTAVFERDDHRCMDCGERGGQLNADHIYPFAHYPRLRFDVDNGRTLCENCHKKTSTFMGRSKPGVNTNWILQAV